MLAIFYGNDTVKVRQKALAFAEAEASTDTRPSLIDSDSYERGLVSSLAGEASLFGGRAIYVLDTPSADQDFFAAVVEGGESLHLSSNLFVVIEGALLADPKKKITKHADAAEEYKAVDSGRFNTFALADALAKKDKKLLWLLWHEALLKRISPEEIAGVLWWQLKTLRLAGLGTTAAAVGLKDFPYKKALGALRNFKAGELQELSHSLLSLLHESRLGRQDTLVSLERWILKL
jgi:DNA polymerase III delta subunit